MFKKLIRYVKILYYEIKKSYQYVVRFIRTNVLINRLFFLLLCSFLVVFSLFIGNHHKNKEEYIKAMTVSDINQELEFSKTGAKFKLEPQERYKDMTVIPFRIKDTASQSLDAKDYLVALMPITKKELPKETKTSILFFGVTGEGAIVIKGKLPKEPVNVIVRNDSSFTSNNSGSGTVTVNGIKQKVNYNGVSFTINPKANNVKQNKLINTDMKMSDLYYVSFANRQIKNIKSNYKKSVKKERNKENEFNEYVKRVKKMNKTLGKDENDVSYDNSEEDSDSVSTKVSTSDLDDIQNDADISNTELENYRNSAIDKLANIKDEIDAEKDRQEGLKAQADQLKEFVANKVYRLTSINSKTELYKNNKVK